MSVRADAGPQEGPKPSSKYHRCLCLLERLKDTQDPEYLLMGNLIEVAEMFIKPELLYKLKLARYPRLEGLLMQVRADSWMSIQ